jgi:hypothetical protein
VDWPCNSLRENKGCVVQNFCEKLEREWEDNIKSYLRELSCENVRWVGLDMDLIERQTLLGVLAFLNLCVLLLTLVSY